jgi:paraquat-inducible protein B
MSDAGAPSPPPSPPPPVHQPVHPEAHVQTRRSFQVIWLIPIVAAAIAIFLGWRAISERGPTIRISFATADGITAGQTKIKHKSVDLGTVHSITLSKDMSHVIVSAEMRREAERFLTTNTRFWVVRPRLSVGGITGLETLLSGAFIEMDPGEPGGSPATRFTGLDTPPAVRWGEPGHSFTLIANRLGSLSPGSPVFYRDIAVGEVLNYEVHPTARPEHGRILLHVFIHAPYDAFVRTNTHFWNVSGVSVQFGAEGVRLEMESLQALLSGGIAFGTAPGSTPGAVVTSEATAFVLYDNEAAANIAGYKDSIPFLVYFKGSVRGLAVGAPVELFGIQIGSVTDIKLEFDPTGANTRVAVRLAVQPERVLGSKFEPAAKPIDIARKLVAQGLRVQLRSANYITGQLFLAMDFFPNAPPGEAEEHDGAILLPSLPGGLEGLTSSLGQILQKIQALPLEEIAQHLDTALAGVADLTTGAQTKESLRALSATLVSLQELIRQTNAGVGPALARLPQIAQGLQTAMDRANRLLASADTGYGNSSQFRRDLERMMDNFSDAARSIRLLADFLDQHPEALLRGRTGQAGAP